jgi:AraC family transcriptional activator FtrA
MNYKLNNNQDWLELARHANWSVSKLAARCGVSERTLRRYFIRHLGQPPKTWLSEQRQRHGYELLCNGSSVKETAACLGYKQSTNFTRKYKNHWGICPSVQLVKTAVPSVSRLDVRK